MDLNKFINLQRGNRYGGAKAKKDQTNLCTMYIKRAMADGLSVKKYPITVKFKWVMPNRRKDKDNIAFAKKFILDGMQEAGLIVNDGWSQIDGFEDEFEVDKENARVEIEIKY
jgi:Holliday junction resolvase RusA-like endonuclease